MRSDRMISGGWVANKKDICLTVYKGQMTRLKKMLVSSSPLRCASVPSLPEKPPSVFPNHTTDILSNVTDCRNLYSGQPLSKLPESLQELVSLTHD